MSRSRTEFNILNGISWKWAEFCVRQGLWEEFYQGDTKLFSDLFPFTSIGYTVFIMPWAVRFTQNVNTSSQYRQTFYEIPGNSNIPFGFLAPLRPPGSGTMYFLHPLLISTGTWWYSKGILYELLQPEQTFTA